MRVKKKIALFFIISVIITGSHITDNPAADLDSASPGQCKLVNCSASAIGGFLTLKTFKTTEVSFRHGTWKPMFIFSETSQSSQRSLCQLVWKPWKPTETKQNLISDREQLRSRVLGLRKPQKSPETTGNLEHNLLKQHPKW